jgi:CspA family cold shock protein
MRQRGYGFIQPDNGSKDVFVHISAVEKAGLSTLNEGAKASYEEVPNKGKTSAENFEGRVTSEGHGEARRFTPGGGSLRRVSVVPIARRIEALEPLKALYAEISATGG